jgi:hypothetical protein
VSMVQTNNRRRLAGVIIYECEKQFLQKQSKLSRTPSWLCYNLIQVHHDVAHPIKHLQLN